MHKSTVDRLTRLVLCHLSQGVKEEDRLFLEVILAIEVNLSACLLVSWLVNLSVLPSALFFTCY